MQYPKNVKPNLNSVYYESNAFKISNYLLLFIHAQRKKKHIYVALGSHKLSQYKISVYFFHVSFIISFLPSASVNNRLENGHVCPL